MNHGQVILVEPELHLVGPSGGVAGGGRSTVDLGYRRRLAIATKGLDMGEAISWLIRKPYGGNYRH